MDGTQILGLVVIVAVIVWLTSKAIFATYFKEREAYMDRYVDKVLTKWKGKSDGKS